MGLDTEKGMNTSSSFIQSAHSLEEETDITRLLHLRMKNVITTAMANVSLVLDTATSVTDEVTK